MSDFTPDDRGAADVGGQPSEFLDAGPAGLDGPEPGNELDEVAGEGNRLVGAVPKSVLEYIARSIADDPEGVFVDAQEGRGDVTLRLHVSPGDMGRVIGKHGRVAQAIRQVVRAAGSREGVRATVDIVD